jgi:hypothetical protein
MKPYSRSTGLLGILPAVQALAGIPDSPQQCSRYQRARERRFSRPARRTGRCGPLRPTVTRSPPPTVLSPIWELPAVFRQRRV